MDVLRHAGGNWSRGAAAASADGALIAVAVRSSVMLVRATDGGFVGEVRQPGRPAPRSTALTFAAAPGLRHLLAVGADDGAVRVYDVHTRRLVRIALQPRENSPVAALCFGADTPDLLFVASPCRVTVCELASLSGSCGDVAAAVVATTSWDMPEDLRSPTCLVSATGFPSILFVGGGRGRGAGAVAAVNVRTGVAIALVRHTPGPVHAIDVLEHAVVGRAFVAFVSGSSGVPSMAVWYQQQFTVCNEVTDICGAASTKGQEMSASLSWLPSGILVCSKACGGLQLWHCNAAHRLVAVAGGTLEQAHSRQVFAVCRLASVGDEGAILNDGSSAGELPRYSFATVSMDRRMCAWSCASNSARSTIRMEWEAVGYGGHVQAIACRRLKAVEYLAYWLGVAGDGVLVATGCRDGYIYLDYCADCESPPTIARTVLQYRLPRATGGVAVTVTCLCFSVLSCESGGDPGEDGELAFLHAGLSDGRLACLVLGHGTSKNVTAILSSESQTREMRRSPRSVVETISSIAPYVEGGSTCLLCITSSGRLVRWKVSFSGSKKQQAVTIQKTTELTTWQKKVDDGRFAEGYGRMSCATTTNDGDHLVVIGTSSGCVFVFDLSDSISGDAVTKASHGMPCISTIACNASGDRVAIASADGAVAVLTRHGCALALSWSQLSAHARGVSSLNWHAFRLLSTSDDGSARVFSADDGEAVVLRGHGGRVLAGAWLSEQIVLTGGEDCSLRMWDINRQPKTRDTARFLRSIQH
jgi:WD domain, G-beta repeat